MGSKRAMLQNGLGELLTREICTAKRFVDLFSGSAAVARYVAIKFSVPVLAVDLQAYSKTLAESIIARGGPLNGKEIWQDWKARALSKVETVRFPRSEKLTQAIVRDFRRWCAAQESLQVTKAYGGHYFSPQQAVWIDALRTALPDSNPDRSVCLGALIRAASKSAAAPGHTAQPFQPTRTAKEFLLHAWSMDVVEQTRGLLKSLAKEFARVPGEALVADANIMAKTLSDGDLVFVDPPYSGVHYSRFYHVLETIARGECGAVAGTGRYPARERRPRSHYSLRRESAKALEDLLSTLASKNVRAILTFPDHVCSNGLSGEDVRAMGRKYFKVREKNVKSRFSTLGGRGDEENSEAGRLARRDASELMMLLSPK